MSRLSPGQGCVANQTSTTRLNYVLSSVSIIFFSSLPSLAQTKPVCATQQSVISNAPSSGTCRRQVRRSEAPGICFVSAPSASKWRLTRTEIKRDLVHVKTPKRPDELQLKREMFWRATPGGWLLNSPTRSNLLSKLPIRENRMNGHVKYTPLWKNE